MDSASNDRRVALLFSGGMGLGAYQAGAYAELCNEPQLPFDWIAGSSVGAINAAIVAGVAPGERVERLRAFWISGDPWRDLLMPQPPTGPWRHVLNWASAAQTRLAGSPGHFRPRYLSRPFERYTSLYDLSPLRARLAELVDFERLNRGELRFTLATTDVATGETVMFDTARGARITADHILASCGFLPEFAPTDIGGRVLGDGGLSANAPVEALLDDDTAAGERIAFVVDLFARDGALPTSLESALARKNDLLFGNQTFLRLQALQRESVLRERLARRQGEAAPDDLRVATRVLFYLSYRAPPEEAGPEKLFDMSRITVEDRWQAGALDMREALARYRRLPAQLSGCELVAIRRPERKGARLE